MATQNVNSSAHPQENVEDQQDKCGLCEAPGGLNKTIQCHDCKRWVHYRGTKLPLYQLWFLAHSPRNYSCENCCTRKLQASDQEWITVTKEALAEGKNVPGLSLDGTKAVNEAPLGNTPEDINLDLDVSQTKDESLTNDEKPAPDTPTEDPTLMQATAQLEAGNPARFTEGTRPKKNNNAPRICYFYRFGNCRYGPSGKDCKYSHPKPCRKSDHGCKMEKTALISILSFAGIQSTSTNALKKTVNSSTLKKPEETTQRNIPKPKFTPLHWCHIASTQVLPQT